MSRTKAGGVTTDFDALKYIGGVFLDWELPRERLYLFRYFRTTVERAFLRYFYCFGSFDLFTDHTGYYCQIRWLKLLKKRHDQLVVYHDEAKKQIAIGNNDEGLKLLAEVESGKLVLRRAKFT